MIFKANFSSSSSYLLTSKYKSLSNGSSVLIIAVVLLPSPVCDSLYGSTT